MPLCEGCRRPLLDAATNRAPLWADEPDGPYVHQCRDCRGLYGVFEGNAADAPQLVRMTSSATAAMALWWRALAGTALAVQLHWQAAGRDGQPEPPGVLVAATSLPGDRLSKAGRVMMARALPPDELLWPITWHPAEPVSWVLWDETPATVSMSERHGPRVVMREVWTRATDYGAPEDPAMFGPGPHRASPTVACAWWASMLTPIHLARVALLRAGPEGAAAVRLSARDRADLAAPANVADAGFADLLARRSAVSRGILAALGWPLPPDAAE